eukprot:6197662-Pleurochrysis_carterae.AAC.2
MKTCSSVHGCCSYNDWQSTSRTSTARAQTLVETHLAGPLSPRKLQGSEEHKQQRLSLPRASRACARHRSHDCECNAQVNRSVPKSSVRKSANEKQSSTQTAPDTHRLEHSHYRNASGPGYKQRHCRGARLLKPLLQRRAVEEHLEHQRPDGHLQSRRYPHGKSLQFNRGAFRANQTFACQ